MKTFTHSDHLEASRLEKLHAQISLDIEIMHQKEASLREYEQRLRLLVDQADSAKAAILKPSPAPSFHEDQANLDAEWEKHYRAQGLLEAARRGLADDRLLVKNREEKVQQREAEAARREAELSQRESSVHLRELDVEAQAHAVAQAQAELQARIDSKAKSSLTTAPFLAARNLLLLRRN